MEYLTDLKQILNDYKEIIETKNFYYDNHICSSTGKNIKVNLDYTLKDNKTNKIVNIGYCNLCSTIFYHEDYDTNSK